MALELVLDEVQNWTREDLIDSIATLSEGLELEQRRSERLLESARRLGRLARDRSREHREILVTLEVLERSFWKLDGKVTIALRDRDQRASLQAWTDADTSRELLRDWLRLAEAGRDPQPFEVVPLAARTTRFLGDA